MDFQLKYANELNKLKKPGDDIDFFCNLDLSSDDFNVRKEAINELFKFAKDNNLDNVKAWAYYFLGWYNFDKAHYYKAADCYMLANDIFERLNNRTGLIYVCNGLTNVYCQIGQFKLSNEWGLKGISLCEETKNMQALVMLLINTGINYIQMKYFSKARDVFHSLELIDYELTEIQQISCCLALGEIEINIGEPKLAFSYIDCALKIETELNIYTDICEMHKLKGMAFLKLKLYDLAEQEFKKAYDFSDKLDFIYEKCCSMVEWSKLHILVGRKNQAAKLLNEVVEICSNRELNTLLRESYHILYTVYKDLNMSDKALSFLERYISIDDEMYDYEQNQLMAEMDLKHTKREADRYKSLYDKTELLSTIGQKIISNLNIQSIVEIIHDEINKLVETDYFGIAVYEKAKNHAMYYFVGENLQLVETFQVNESVNDSFGAYCINNKKDIIIGNSEKEYAQYIENEPIELKEEQDEEKSHMLSIIYTPMIVNGNVVGLMTVQSRKENTYNQNDLHTIKILANYSAIAIQNAKSYSRVEELATYDNLTKFLTRSEIIRIGEIIYNKYSVSNSRFSVTMIDIDNFKSINDSYGHVLGDRALSMVSETIKRCIRNTDFIGRYGGDEFLLICPGLREPEAVDVAERIRASVESKLYNLGDGEIISITISLGVHEYSEDDKSFIDVVKFADKNLYMAKRNNKNMVICS